jgi:hypothetical protein
VVGHPFRRLQTAAEATWSLYTAESTHIGSDHSLHGNNATTKQQAGASALASRTGTRAPAPAAHSATRAVTQQLSLCIFATSKVAIEAPASGYGPMAAVARRRSAFGPSKRASSHRAARLRSVWDVKLFVRGCDGTRRGRWFGEGALHSDGLRHKRTLRGEPRAITASSSVPTASTGEMGSGASSAAPAKPDADASVPAAEHRTFELRHPGTCTGMFWRGDPRSGSRPSERDWPRNGSLLSGIVHSDLDFLHVFRWKQAGSSKWSESADKGLWMPFQQGGPLLHETKA